MVFVKLYDYGVVVSILMWCPWAVSMRGDRYVLRHMWSKGTYFEVRGMWIWVQYFLTTQETWVSYLPLKPQAIISKRLLWRWSLWCGQTDQACISHSVLPSDPPLPTLWDLVPVQLSQEPAESLCLGCRLRWPQVRQPSLPLHKLSPVAVAQRVLCNGPLPWRT